MKLSRDKILGGLWGAVVGDALGVPVEFKDRAVVQANPITGMRGYGTHHQPPGTWSDDSSMLLCTVESLVAAEFDVADMGARFVRWFRDFHWTPHGETFDIGMTTADALLRIEHGASPETAGSRDEYSNGNGSLMRIMPVALRFAASPGALLAERAHRASAITHAHPRSQMACAFYSMAVRQLLAGVDPAVSLDAARTEFGEHYGFSPEFSHFRRALEDDFRAKPEGEIVSTGYVIHTLHASLWCLLTTASFEECVLKAVNLGGDTDTTGCVAGGLAGVHYGLDAIPMAWRNELARAKELEALFDKFTRVVSSD